MFPIFLLAVQYNLDILPFMPVVGIVHVSCQTLKILELAKVLLFSVALQGAHRKILCSSPVQLSL
jgi:hypothetical protein